jgi:hypothetical protein
MKTRLRYYRRCVLGGLRQANPEKAALFQGLEEGKMDGWDRNKLQGFIEQNKLNLNGGERIYFGPGLLDSTKEIEKR